MSRPYVIDGGFPPFHNTFIRTALHIHYLVNFCPECGGDLKFDTVSKDFICKSCGLFASREKLDEIRDKRRDQLKDGRRAVHDDYLDWWQTSKKEKQSK
jgi:TFIIB zinc-binding protein